MQATKIRYKGWWSAFYQLQINLKSLIAGTPTSELRNRLTDLNSAVMELEKFAKEQKEVL